jgi:drug/metabolite transporter (DMT)-like permease
MSVPVALSAAVTYGVADFAGGFAARRAPVLVVTAVAQTAGLLALLPAVGLVPGQPSAAALGFGAAAGIAGAGGLLLYMRALAVGPMGVVAPLSAVISAGLPLGAGLLGGEVLGPIGVLAIALALVAILLATAGSRQDAAASTGLLLGLAAGVGFGLFFVGLDATPPDSGLWPLVGGRITSVTLLAALVVRHHLPLPVRRLRARAAVGACSEGSDGGPDAPARTASGQSTRALVLVMVACGLFDTLANVLFLVAARLGDLGISAVVVSLYPVVVVLLARAVLAERLTRMQVAGTALALVASVLLAAA